jgi:hypothetical protein
MWHFGKKRGLRGFVFAMLQRGPRNGAELINDMEFMTHGRWRPSPGSVYPLLEEMVTEGSIRKQEDGRYVLLAMPMYDWGFQPVHPRTPKEVVREIAGLTAYLEDLRRDAPGGFDEPIDGEIDRLVERLRKLRN